jgi:hypothetical protein
MKKLVLLFVTMVFFASFSLVGCAFNVTELQKLDSSVNLIISPDGKEASADCWAGFAEGITSGATLSPDINGTVQAMKSVADQGSADYKACKGKGAKIAFLVRAGRAKIDSLLSNVMGDLVSLGIKP